MFNLKLPQKVFYFLLFVFGLFLTPSFVYATTYYVAKDGRSGDFTSIQPAADAAKPQAILAEVSRDLDGNSRPQAGGGQSYQQVHNLSDMNDDGLINSFEFGYLIAHWGESCPAHPIQSQKRK